MKSFASDALTWLVNGKASLVLEAVLIITLPVLSQASAPAARAAEETWALEEGG